MSRTISAGILVFCAISLGGYFWYLQTQSFSTIFSFFSKGVEERNIIDDLLHRNTTFKSGWKLLEEYRFAEALSAFDTALIQARTPAEEAQIKFVIADTLTSSGAFVEAVRAFKEIIANQSYPLIHRAYAATEVGIILSDHGEFASHHMHPGEDEHDLSPIAEEVFSTEPYASILRDAFSEPGGGRDLAERRVYEYAESLYPLSYAVMGSVRMYAVRLYDAYYGGAITSQEIEEAVRILQEKVVLAQADIDSRIGKPHETKYIPIALIGIGFAHEMLWRYGYEEDASEAEKAYRRAAEVYQVGTIKGGAEYYAYYQYAYFLARAYGSERESDIRSLLSYYRLDNKEIPLKAKEILLETKGHAIPEGRQKARDVMCEAAPNFREYLISIGWKKGEFCAQ